MANFSISILSVVVVANIILGLVIFSRGLRSFTNIIFGLISIASALWGLAIIGFYSDIYHFTLNWVVFTHSLALLIPFLFLCFSLYFPKKLTYSSVVIGIATIPLLIFEGLIVYGHTVVGLTHNEVYELGLMYPYFSITLVSFFIAGFIFSFVQSKRAKDSTEKKQAEYVLIGSFIASTLAIIPDLILPYLHMFQYTWLGPIFTLIMVVSLFLAMFKYHLFNVKVILTEIVSIVIVVALLIELLTAQTISEIILKAVVLVIVTIFAYILILGVYREIAQREKIELLAKDLQKANDRLKELDKQKSEFISFASHQLRGPLTAMKGYGSLLLEGDMGALTKEAHEGVRRIFDSTNTLVHIVDDYLNISRIELGTMKYIFEKIDLRDLVDDVIAELAPTINNAPISFAFAPEETSKKYMISADRDKLKQVISNLIDNSLKYTPSGKIGVTLSTDKVSGKYVFKIKDTGIGISSETLPHLFQKFSRATNANKTNIKGTGLGLFVAKQMVEANHGTIHAESDGEGKGSTFVVELEPLAEM